MREFLAYYYDKAQEWGKEYRYLQVARSRPWLGPRRSGRRFDTLTYHDWLTDTTVDDGRGWSYPRCRLQVRHHARPLSD